MENKRHYLKDYISPAYQVKHLNLHFNLHETSTKVTSHMQLKRLRNEDLILNGEQLDLQSVQLNGQELTNYQKTEHHLSISDLPEEFELKIVVEINPETNKSCEGLYLSKGIFCTQCEAEGFRKITYFLDRPDVMTTYTVEIEADKTKYPRLLSNGDCVEKRSLDNGRHYTKWNDPFKKPSYLFALVAGDLGVIEDYYTTKSGKKVKLEVFAAHGKQDRCGHAMESLKKSMKWDEERFGLEYDLNQFMIVAIDDFNMGAMENKGLNIFNSRLVLADKESATDTDFHNIEAVVGHEYFHNWTGNRITCRNWFELSLKEGLTVFRDQEFSSDLHSRPVERISQVQSLRSRQFPEDAGPNAHPVRPESCLSVNNFYTATIYEKGAEIIRMMSTMLGKQGFRRGMDEYFKCFDGQAVTIDDFAAAISEANKVDFTQFKLWYSKAGTPEIYVTEKYDPASKAYELTLEQKCDLTKTEKETGFNKKPFHIPLIVGLIGPNGEDLPIKCKDVVWNTDEKPLLHLKNSKQTFIFTDLGARPVLSLNRQFSAPVKLKWSPKSEDLYHLIKFDSDEFNRFENCQKMILEEVQSLIHDKDLNPKVIEVLGSVLKDSKIDPMFKSLLLTLPSDQEITLVESLIQPEAFHKARHTIYKRCVENYSDELLTMYKKHHMLDSEGDRSLKNRVLRYLYLGEHPEGLRLVKEQFDHAKNMTDSFAALVLVCNQATAERDEALHTFFERWKTDAVILNKWLSAQATSPAFDTFQKVKDITGMTSFDPHNPNNLYSLHLAFAQNYLSFLTDDGEAIRWFSEEIERVDKENPQVASRLCSQFNFVKKFPAAAKAVATEEITRLLALPKLSRNCRELLEKCL